ncbi:MAG: hypothetical protein WCZ66_10755 [Sphingomonadaceae bacterium]
MKSSFFVLLAIVFGRGSVVVAGMLISSALGAAAFAAFSFAHVTATAASNIAAVGMQNALPRYFARLQMAGARAESGSNTLMAILFAGAGLAVAVLIILVIPDELIGVPEPVLYLFLPALLFVVGVKNLFVGAANGLECFSRVSGAALMQGAALIVATVVSIGVRSIEVALWGYVLATAIGTAVIVPRISSVLLRLTRARPYLSLSTARNVAQFAGPLFLVTILSNSGIWLSGRTLLGGDEDVFAFAQFAVGLQWFGLTALASVVVSKAAMPALTRSAVVKNHAIRRQTMIQAVLLSGGSALLVLLAVLVFPHKILALYGPELSGARSALQLFVAAALLASPINIISSALIAERRQTSVLVTALLWWSSLMVLLILLTDRGAAGVAFAVVISYALYLGGAIIAGIRHGIFLVR